MRTIARIFTVLFCLTFLANQVQSQPFLDLGTIVGQLIAYTSSGLEVLSERITVHDERLLAIEKQLAKTSDFSITSLQAEKWNRRVRAKAEVHEAARADLANSLGE